MADQRTKGEKEQDRMLVAQMYVEGHTYEAIAQAIDRSVTTVSKDIRAIRQEWKEQRLAGYEAAVVDELARISQVQAEAWAAWNRSHGQIITIDRKQRKLTKQARDYLAESHGVDPDVLEAIVGFGEVEVREKIETSAGAPEFLRIVLECSKERRRLLGLDAPERTETIVSTDDPTGRSRDALLEELDRPFQELGEIVARSLGGDRENPGDDSEDLPN